MKTEIEVLEELIKEVKALNENWLKVLRSIPRKDEPYIHDYTADPAFPRGDPPAFTTTTTYPCAWDSISEQDKLNPMGLSCSCPKCSTCS
jgi:hypothetical protein